MLPSSALADYYVHEPGVTLIPIEHLSPAGMSATCAELLRARRGWTPERVQLFNRAFASYWSRTEALARHTRTWSPPRLRHVAVVGDSHAVRPYAQLLNTSAWTLYDSDVDPARSHPELAAYLLVHGDRMALTGEITLAALHNAAYWFERSDAERAAFAAAAAQSTRPDAAAFQALATATAWLRQLSHDDLRPPPVREDYRAIPHTGLRVPCRLEAEPPLLAEQWTNVAKEAVGRFHAHWGQADLGAVNAVSEWLVTAAPPLVVTAARGRIVWEPSAAGRIGALRSELKRASGAAVRDLHADLAVIDRHTRAFFTSLVDPDALPWPASGTEQRGYTYLHHERRLIAYNLDEPHVERRRGPALPYARAMLGARTVHEWAHAAVDAGWVPVRGPVEHRADLIAAVGDELDAVVAATPAAIRAQTRADLATLGGESAADCASPGTVLAQTLMTRMPDYQANLLACRYLSLHERETYVRHNVRTLRGRYAPAQLWRMLIRYLSEYQYLRFSAVADPRTYFLHSTWFDDDFFTSGVLDETRFARLTDTVAQLCDEYVIDERRFRPVEAG